MKRSLVVAVALLPSPLLAQNTVSYQMAEHLTEDADSSLTTTGYGFEVHIDSSVDMSNWGPKFKYPTGTTSVALSGTGSPNNGSGFKYESDFSSASALSSAYPDGTYSMVFKGTSAPTGSVSTLSVTTDASNFASIAQPYVTGENNGATWGANNTLYLESGTTTLTLNPFSQFGSGAEIENVGLVDSAGNVIGTAYGEDDIANFSTSGTLKTSYTIDSSLLKAGQTYTLEIQYDVLPSTVLDAGTLNGTSFAEAEIVSLQNSFNVELQSSGGSGAAPEPVATATALGLTALVGAFALRRRPLAA